MAGPLEKHQTGAVRLYAADHPVLARNLRAKLEKRRNELAVPVVEGVAQDWADYKGRVGVIKGLDEAIQICIAVENQMDGDR